MQLSPIKISINNNFMGFRLLDLTVKNHYILGDNTFEFYNGTDNSFGLYYTVIIGPNGTGKSELLKVLLNIFKTLNDFSNGEKKKFDESAFRLRYLNNGNLYSFANSPSEYFDSDKEKKVLRFNKNLRLSKNNQELKEFDVEDVIPRTIIAHSIMLTDKFIVPRNQKEKDSFPMYKYLGVRYRPQQASTRYYVRNTVENIVNNFDSELFRTGLKELIKFLELKGAVNIIYRTINTPKFFTSDVSKGDLDLFFEDIETRYFETNKTPPFKLNRYKLLSKEEGKIERLCKFIREEVNNNTYHNISRSSAKLFKFNLLDNESYIELNRKYEFLETLRQIGFVDAPYIRIEENSSSMSLSEASSGEFHFFSTMIGLLSNFNPNSIVLIDEPEISLHPNWQMKYLDFTRKLFSGLDYGMSHVVIATHSHFLISDLKGDSSNIIGLKKEDQKISVVPLEYDLNTYGWSAEEVLYKVFEVRTTRNHYLEVDLRELLSLIARNSKDNARIKMLLSRISDVQLSEYDPLKLVISQAKEYLAQ
ncbi:MAG: AAA family ATPase [Bacteroidales bacterium]|nr:AAA family ATPase [Bacteroidales bacterium]